MTKQRPLLRNCPCCGVAVVGRKADARSAGHDTYECALCGTVVSFAFEDRRSAEPRAAVAP